MKYNLFLISLVSIIILNLSFVYSEPLEIEFNDDDLPKVTMGEDDGLYVTTTSYSGNLTNLSQMQDTNIDDTTTSDGDTLVWSSALKKWVASVIAGVKWYIYSDNGFLYTNASTLFFNDTFANEMYNQTDLINSINDSLGEAGNLSWNESKANDLYADITGDNFTGNINMTGNNVSAGWFKGFLNWSWIQNVPAIIGINYTLVGDGRYLPLKVTDNPELYNGTIKLANVNVSDSTTDIKWGFDRGEMYVIGGA